MWLMIKVAGVNLTSGFGLFGDSLYLFTLFYISLSLSLLSL
ncbi:unnamed protein product [Brassica rapa subsp. narinosa]